MGKIVKYYRKEGYFGKLFSVPQALKDGWNIEHKEGWWKSFIGTILVDRKKPTHTVTVSRIETDDMFYFVYFKEGGWLLLDHTIEQFDLLKKEQNSQVCDATMLN